VGILVTMVDRKKRHGGAHAEVRRSM